MTLPTEKTPPALGLAEMKALIYGEAKVGKSTLAAGIDPDHTLFLACEAGLGGLDVFQVPVRSWEEFRESGSDLANNEHDFTTVVVDTADELLRFCTEYVCDKLGIDHPADLDYGRGWNAVSEEWRLRVGKLASLGLGVLFVSHAKNVEIKQRVATVSKAVPDLSGKPGSWLMGSVDFIFYAAVEQTDDGERRILRTQPGESWEAGGRLTLPDPLPLDAAALAEAITVASNLNKPQPELTEEKAA